MVHRKIGIVISVTGTATGIEQLTVEAAGEAYPALNFVTITGPAHEGDEVLLNTTAVDLGLGSGGSHFVMANLSDPLRSASNAGSPSQGHIMKVRYTPGQVKVLSVEEPESPHHNDMRTAENLEGKPVVCCTLHSMLPAAAAGIKAVSNKLRVVFVMTDGAALPLQMSRMAAELKDCGALVGTVSSGHSFGGDLEAVNVYSALLAAKHVLRADAAVVSMGPGIVGTPRPYGFTGIEQADIINTVGTLEGKPVAVPRIAFSDTRERHRGLSHHSLTALGRASVARALVVLPQMGPERLSIILEQIEHSGISGRHTLVFEDGCPGLELLKDWKINVTTMGRSMNEEREFFLTACAGGTTAAKVLLGQPISIFRGG